MSTTAWQQSNTDARFALGSTSSGDERIDAESLKRPFLSDFKVPERSLEAFEAKELARAIIKKRFKEEDWQALLAERQVLLDRKLIGDATRSDLNRLEYVRWTLDKIEDAKYGASLDMVEGSISHYESILESIEQLHKDLEKNRIVKNRK